MKTYIFSIVIFSILQNKIIGYNFYLLSWKMLKRIRKSTTGISVGKITLSKALGSNGDNLFNNSGRQSNNMYAEILFYFLRVYFLFYFYLFIFPFICISWRLITLQYCSGFCHILT